MSEGQNILFDRLDDLISFGSARNNEKIIENIFGIYKDKDGQIKIKGDNIIAKSLEEDYILQNLNILIENSIGKPLNDQQIIELRKVILESLKEVKNNLPNYIEKMYLPNKNEGDYEFLKGLIGSVKGLMLLKDIIKELGKIFGDSNQIKINGKYNITSWNRLLALTYRLIEEVPIVRGENGRKTTDFDILESMLSILEGFGIHIDNSKSKEFENLYRKIMEYVRYANDYIVDSLSEYLSNIYRTNIRTTIQNKLINSKEGEKSLAEKLGLNEGDVASLSYRLEELILGIAKQRFIAELASNSYISVAGRAIRGYKLYSPIY